MVNSTQTINNAAAQPPHSILTFETGDSVCEKSEKRRFHQSVAGRHQQLFARPQYLRFRFIQQDEQERGNGTEQQGQQKPVQAATVLPLRDSGVEQRERSPANGKSGCVFHIRSVQVKRIASATSTIWHSSNVPVSYTTEPVFNRILEQCSTQAGRTASLRGLLPVTSQSCILAFVILVLHFLPAFSAFPCHRGLISCWSWFRP